MACHRPHVWYRGNTLARVPLPAPWRTRPAAYAKCALRQRVYCGAILLAWLKDRCYSILMANNTVKLDQVDLDKVVTYLANAVHCESSTPVADSSSALRIALIQDGRIPTDYECECLVFGGPLNSDEDREDNSEITNKFPHTDAAIRLFVE